MPSGSGRVDVGVPGIDRIWLPRGHGRLGRGAWHTKVVAVAGDSGFGEYLAEFTTAVKHGMDITLVLLNNGELGKISREQISTIRPVWQTDLVNPDFAAYAQSCGGVGMRVTTRAELGPAFAAAMIVTGKPALVEVHSSAQAV